MSYKRGSEAQLTSLVPITKKPRNELAIQETSTAKKLMRSSLSAPIVILTGHESEIFCSKFSKRHSLLASAGFDRKIFLWHVEGECDNIAVLQGHTGAIMGLKFTPDSSELVTCSTDKNVLIWDLNTLERVKRYKGHKAYINAIDVTRQMPQIICTGSDDHSIKLWDRRKKAEANNFSAGAPVLCVAFNETGEQIITGGLDNELKVWDLRKNGMIYKMKGHTDSPTGLSLSPDGSFVASNAMDNTVRVWDIRPFAPEQRCTKILIGHNHNFEKNLLRVAWSADSQYISAGSADKFLYVWNFENCNLAYKLPGHQGSINDVDFHPDEPIIASASSDRKVYLGEI